MTFLYILLAIAIFLVLITVHELGHYISGKLLKFKINEFSIGFGKAIFSKTNKKTGEKFSIRIFPLGGYCAFEGEDEENKNPAAFNNQKPWKRLIVLFSGVFMNFLFGVLTAAIFLMASGNLLPKISYVAPANVNSSSIQVGDVIERVNGKKLESWRSIDRLVKGFDEGEAFNLTVLRNGKREVVSVQKYAHDAYFFVGNEAKIVEVFDEEGVAFSSPEQLIEILDQHPDSFDGLFFDADGNAFSHIQIVELLAISGAPASSNLGIVFNYIERGYGFFESLGKAFPFSIYILYVILTALAGLFTGATAVSDLGGTVTAISQVAEYSQMGIKMILYLVPVLSLNLALFNFLPIPALDGSRFLFVLIEWIRGKPIKRSIEGYIHMVGLFVLLGLVVFLDIYHFFIA